MTKVIGRGRITVAEVHDGDDAYQVIVNPEQLVFDTANDGFVTSSALAASPITVMIHQGSMDRLPSSVEIDNANCENCAAKVVGNIVTLTKILTDTTTKRSAGRGYVGIKATLEGRIFSAKIPFAVNFHTVMAEWISKQDELGGIVKSVREDFNGYKSKTETKITALDGQIDLAIKKTVGGTNLLKGASLRWDSVKLTESCTQQVVEQRQSANASVRRYSGTSDAAHNGHAFVKVEMQNQTTPQYGGVFFITYVEKDKEYTVSAWVNSSDPANTCLELYISDAVDKRKNAVWFGKNYLCDNDIVGKWQYIKETFTAPKSGWLRVYLWLRRNGTLYISEVQLEEGNTATSWHDPDVDEQFAALNLKADNIKLGLKNIGINIDEEAVSIIADKFRVKSANGTPIAVFKLGVNGNPILQAPYIDVDNLTVKKIEGAIGTFKEIYSSEGAMPNHPELAMTMRLTNNIIMFDSKDIKARFGLGTLPATSGFPDIPLCLDVKNDRGGAIGAYISAISNAPVYDLDPSIEGSHALYIQNGNISGFRLYSKRSRGSMTLSKMDNVIVDLNEAGDSTYTLPSGCEDGQFYMIFSTSEEISIKTSGIDRFSYRDKSTTMDVDPWDLTFLVYDARNHKWNMRFARQT